MPVKRNTRGRPRVIEATEHASISVFSRRSVVFTPCFVFRIFVGSSGGVSSALSPPLQRHPERQVLPGDHVFLRTSPVEPPLQGPEERGKDGDG